MPESSIAHGAAQGLAALFFLALALALATGSWQLPARASVTSAL